jgi:CheY-like chemotaxis protein
MNDSLRPIDKQIPPLLIVEDSDEDFEVFRRHLQKSPVMVPLLRCKNGEEALALLSRTGNYAGDMGAPLPSVILLDLNLPLIDGREVLMRIKQVESLKSIPVVIFTTSSNPKDVEECYKNGANRYIVKAIDFIQLKKDVECIINYWIDVTILPK